MKTRQISICPGLSYRAEKLRMSRHESKTYGIALQQLQAIRQTDNSSGRKFLICANLAWDWALRPSNSWYVWNDVALEWIGPTPQQQKFYEHLLVVVNDFDVVISIIYRLNWMCNKFIGDHNFVSPDDLAAFLLADIHAFHVELRSLMDSLCHVVNVASAKPGQVPTKSFNELRKWCIQNQERSQAALTKELSDLIAESYWFLEIRELRDRIIHKQSDATVRIITPPNEIGFVTWKSKEQDVYEGPTAFTYNQWIYFNPHAGYYIGRLIFLLNEICSMATNQLDLSVSDIHWSSPRLFETEKCIDYAIDSLWSGFPLSEQNRNRHPVEKDFPCASQHEKTAERAYFHWLTTGAINGSELENWLLAERQQARSLNQE